MDMVAASSVAEDASLVSSIPDDEQRIMYWSVAESMERGLRPAKKFAVVPSAWYKDWLKFTSLDSDGVLGDLTELGPNPGPIDCTAIWTHKQCLRPNLLEHEYALLDPAFYSVYKDAYPFAAECQLRAAIDGPSGTLIVELYPISVKFCVAGDPDPMMNIPQLLHLRRSSFGDAYIDIQHPSDLTTFILGENWAVKDLANKVCNFGGFVPSETRFSLMRTYPQLEEIDPIPDSEPQDKRKTLSQLGIVDRTVILVEPRVKAEFPPQVIFADLTDERAWSNSKDIEMTTFSTTFSGEKTLPIMAIVPYDDGTGSSGGGISYGPYPENASNNYSGDKGTSAPAGPPENVGYDPARALFRGTTGLDNIGNTCYMNSGLQCLMHIPQFVEYFLSKQHVQELNPSNPLGFNGEVAMALGNLISMCWSARLYRSVRPSLFKATIGKFNEQFSGTRQQDAQELVSFLLDAVHEDVNLQIKKEYVDKVEGTDFESDEAAASEAWTRHLKRHRSVVVDVFQGLFKSTVVCTSCNKRYYRHVPLCFASLPPPMSLLFALSTDHKLLVGK
jgi:hypothetical protein